MKSVRIRIRSTTPRVPFRAGIYTAVLEEDGDDCRILGTTHGHETWASAAAAALRLADARGYIVFDRPLLQRRAAKEGGYA